MSDCINRQGLAEAHLNSRTTVITLGLPGTSWICTFAHGDACVGVIRGLLEGMQRLALVLDDPNVHPQAQKCWDISLVP